MPHMRLRSLAAGVGWTGHVGSSAGAPADGRYSPGASGADRGTHGAGNCAGMLGGHVRPFGLDHDANERFGTRRAHEDPSLLAQDRLCFANRGPDLVGALERLSISNGNVDEHLRVAL